MVTNWGHPDMFMGGIGSSPGSNLTAGWPGKKRVLRFGNKLLGYVYEACLNRP